MKFIVKKEYGAEVEVKLHYETKDKIKKIFFYGVVVPAVFVSARYLQTENNKNENEK